MKETFCHDIFCVVKDLKHIIENYISSARYLLLLSKKYQTWENLKMTSTFLKHLRSLFLHLVLVFSTQLLTLRAHSSSGGGKCWVKEPSGMFENVEQLCSCSSHVFDLEKESPCTQHLLNFPWLLLTKPDFVKRCMERSGWQLASFCLTGSSKSSSCAWGFPALQLQIPQFLWRTHGTILSSYFHTFGHSLHNFYSDGETRTPKHEERFIPLFFNRNIGF